MLAAVRTREAVDYLKFCWLMDEIPGRLEETPRFEAHQNELRAFRLLFAPELPLEEQAFDHD